jgi:two-component system copper resistance phosphate regulon response regulator CusR
MAMAPPQKTAQAVRGCLQEAVNMKILAVEDDAKTAAYLRKGLGESGYVVDVAVDGQDGIHLATTGSCDLIILDALLPVLDGWTVLLRIRNNGIRTPVLFLSGRDSVEDRVRGLELGADDYLTKPFAFSELLARVRALLRRGQPNGVEVMQVADLELNIRHRRVLRAGRRIDLTPKEFALLALLCQHRSEILSRTVIAEQVWDMNFDSDTNVVDVAIRRLRRKVDEPFPTHLIHSVRGVGYVLDERH